MTRSLPLAAALCLGALLLSGRCENGLRRHPDRRLGPRELPLKLSVG
jgi:hypothetical protein